MIPTLWPGAPIPTWGATPDPTLASLRRVPQTYLGVGALVTAAGLVTGRPGVTLLGLAGVGFGLAQWPWGAEVRGMLPW